MVANYLLNRMILQVNDVSICPRFLWSFRLFQFLGLEIDGCAGRNLRAKRWLRWWFHEPILRLRIFFKMGWNHQPPTISADGKWVVCLGWWIFGDPLMKSLLMGLLLIPRIPNHQLTINVETSKFMGSLYFAIDSGKVGRSWEHEIGSYPNVSLVFFLSLLILLMEEIPNNHLGCIEPWK